MTELSTTDRLHDALAHADVRVDEIPPPVPGWPCRWCQEIAAVCSVTVYWTPRPDVLSDGMADLPALCVVLAAMVPDDLTPSESLAWLTDPPEYERLRFEGVSTYAANALIRGRAA